MVVVVFHEWLEPGNRSSSAAQVGAGQAADGAEYMAVGAAEVLTMGDSPADGVGFESYEDIGVGIELDDGVDVDDCW